MRTAWFSILLLFLSRTVSAQGYAPWGDIHWKSPVASSAALPTSGNLTGDVRMELTLFGLYYWSGSAWVLLSTGGGGSPGGANTDIQFNSGGSFGGSANLTWSGTVLGVTGAVNASNFSDSALTSGLPVLSTAPFSTGTFSGTTTEVATVSGALTPGDGLKVGAGGNVIDSGAPPATVSSVGLSAPADFSVSGSPVTGSGTLSLSYVSQSAATVFAAPSGSSGTPSFRLLVGTDVPSFGGATGGSGGTQGTVPAPTAGQQNDCLLGSGGWGACTSATVSSVGLSEGSTTPIYTITGSPVTSSGTLTFTLKNETANTVFAAPNGVNGQPAFRNLVGADLPNPTLSTLGGVESLTCSAGNALTAISTTGTLTCGAVGGTPGGANTDVQYNSSGSFAGNANWTTDGSGNTTQAGKINATTLLCTNCTANAVTTTDGSKNLTSVASGTSGNVLTDNGSAWVSQAPPAATNQPYGLYNLGLSSSVATNALTVTVIQSNGSAPTAGSPATVAFRNASATSGQYSSVNITSSLAITVPSSATLGQTSGVNQYVWVYALNDAGTPDLCVSGVSFFNSGPNQSSTAISSSATSGSTLYCGSSHTGAKPIRFIGRLLVNETTAGTWASNATDVQINPTVTTTATDTSTSNCPSLTYSAFGTVVSSNVFCSRFGDKLTVTGQVEIGAPTSSAAQINLPSGYALNTVGMGTNQFIVGQYWQVVSGAVYSSTSNGPGVLWYDGSTSGALFFANTATTGTLSKAAGNGPFATNNYIFFNFTIPVAAYSSYGP